MTNGHDLTTVRRTPIHPYNRTTIRLPVRPYISRTPVHPYTLQPYDRMIVCRTTYDCLYELNNLVTTSCNRFIDNPLVMARVTDRLAD